MNAQDMLDYTFGQLDAPRRDLFEQAMADDPELAEKVARLGRSVSSLVDDGEEIEPPSDLAENTLALVARRRQRPAILDFVPTRVPFRWQDVAVAATVLIASLATLGVPLLRSRARMAQAACAFNLGRLGVGLSKYAATNGSYPLVEASLPAGAYGVMLHEAHDLPDPSVLQCPCTGKDQVRKNLPDIQHFREMACDSPAACRTLVEGHYAYHVGYRDRSGKLSAVPDAADSHLPIAADDPPHSDDGVMLVGNSPNHGGAGQNVLYGDGHVAWKRTRWVSDQDKDLYLNEADRPAPGLHPADSALIPSALPVKDR